MSASALSSLHALLPGYEVHSADGLSYVFRGDDGWVVVFEGKAFEKPFRTRREAREHIRAAKVLLS